MNRLGVNVAACTLFFSLAFGVLDAAKPHPVWTAALERYLNRQPVDSAQTPSSVLNLPIRAHHNYVMILPLEDLLRPTARDRVFYDFKREQELAAQHVLKHPPRFHSAEIVQMTRSHAGWGPAMRAYEPAFTAADDAAKSAAAKAAAEVLLAATAGFPSVAMIFDGSISSVGTL